MTAARLRGVGFAVAAAGAIVLLATSPPRIVGDGGEYVAQAMNFAGFHGPSLGRKEIPAIERRLAATSPNLANWRIEASSTPGPDRRRDFVHFWTYALLAAPAMWLTDALGARPEYAFTIVNLSLLSLAMWLLLPRIGGAATALIAAGPLIWWVDKAHTEIFTVSLIAVAMTLMRERPGLALAAAGLAATQNLPVAALYAAILAAHVASRGSASSLARTRPHGLWPLSPDREVAVGAAIGLAFVLLQPAYTYARHKQVSLLINATLPGTPTPLELGAVLLDLNFGLLVCAPAFAAAVTLALFVTLRRGARRLLGTETAVAAACAAVFLFAFASTANFHHGGTPGLSRYALWLFPLAIPVFAHARATGHRLWTVGATAAAIVSTTMALVTYHPARGENSAQPTRLATWLWTRHPGWDNPIPEVFSELVRGEEITRVPTATANCEKVLLAPGYRPQAIWPIPCEPAPVPDWCLAAGNVCYANRRPNRNDYAFAHVNTRQAPVLLEAGVWPRASESHVQRWFVERGWRDLTRPPGGLDVLRAGFGVSTIPLGDENRFVVVLNRPEPGAVVAFRLPRAAAGDLLDPLTGTVVQRVAFDGPANELWSLPVPAGYDILILDMRGVSGQ